MCTEVGSSPVNNYCYVCDSPYYSITEIRTISMVSISVRVVKCPHASGVKGSVMSLS